MAAGALLWIESDSNVSLQMHRITQKAHDLRTPYRRFRRIVERHNRLHFVSQGSSTGAPWAPLSPKYLAWKIAKGFDPRTLFRTGQLFTDATTGLKVRLGRKTATFTVDNPYAIFHQEGTVHMPQREVVRTTSQLANDLARLVADHIA